MKIPINAADVPMTVFRNGYADDILFKLQEQNVEDLKCKNQNDETLYHLIIRNSHLNEEEIIEISVGLLNRKINPNDKNKDEKTPVHLAIEKRMKIVINFFLNCREVYGHEPFATFIECFLKHEFKHFKRKTQKKFWCSREVETESVNYLKCLISKNWDFNLNYDHLILLAINYNLQHIIIFLLNYSSLKDHRNWDSESFLEKYVKAIMPSEMNSHSSLVATLWYHSYISQHMPNIVEILLEKEEFPKKNLLKSIKWAILLKSNFLPITILIDHLALKEDSNAMTSILRYMIELSSGNIWPQSMKHYIHIFRILKSKGANLNGITESEPLLPMTVAFNFKNTQAIDWLINSGADCSLLTNDSQNFLHLLAKTRWKTDEPILMNFYNTFLEQNCNINQIDNNGQTPLHLAVMDGKKILVRKLLEDNAEINVKDKYQRIPLHYAMTNVAQHNLVRILVTYNSDVNAKDINGMLPLITVLLADNTDDKIEMMKILLLSGANPNVLHQLHVKFPGQHFKINRKCCELLLDHGLNMSHERINIFKSQIWWNDVEDSFAQHWIKLNVAGLPCSPPFGMAIKQGVRFKRCYAKCMIELACLKKFSIDSKMTLYDMIYTDVEVIKNDYLTNKKLKSFIKTRQIDDKYPRYSALIKALYYEAKTRKRIIEPAKYAWYKLTNMYLPDLCIERLFNFVPTNILIDITDYVDDEERMIE